MAQIVRVSAVFDVPATLWHGSGAPKPDGTLFEWLVTDFSVYDAFESRLVKVVRWPSARTRHSRARRCVCGAKR